MRTVEVSQASGYSVQQVRDLERRGVIPSAARAANGYREYSARHVSALRAYRGLAIAAGPVRARQLLAGLHAASLAEAAAAVGELHTNLAEQRTRLLEARTALAAVQADIDDTDAESMSITELAGALAVRSSTLRFWEAEGLVKPSRVTSLRVRSYGFAAIRDARIVAALRGGGYGISSIRAILETLHRQAPPSVTGLSEPESTATAAILQEQLDAVATRTIALLEAGADLADVIRSGR